MSEPIPVDVGEIRRLVADITEAGASGDPIARQRILKQFVVQLQVDQQKKEIEARILDPIAFGASELVAPGGVEPPPRP